MRNKRLSWHWAIGLAAACVATLAALLLVNGVSRQTVEAQRTQLLEGVRRAAVACYAAEGRYPQTLDALKERYGLRYDEERFFVHYDAFASNVMPDIAVIMRGKDGL